MNGLRIISTALLGCLATPSLASGDLMACDRVTHVSHGGEEAHVDLGNGKVMWTEWWAQEGAYKDVWIADCDSGQAVNLRTHEERISGRHIVDMTDDARAIATRQARAPAFFTIERVAGLIEPEGFDLRIATYTEEFCACHLAYPELRGTKAAYEVTP